MTAKEYLQQIYHINQRIKRIERQRDDLRASMFGMHSPAGNMDTDRVQISGSGDAMLKMIARVDLLEREILREMDRLIDRKEIITAQIEAMEDERYKTVLFERYVLCRRWELIAEDMHYQIKWVFALHSQALDAFADKYDLRD